jgi:maltooligosyltrehalose synthase
MQALDDRRSKLEQALMHAQRALEGHLAHLTQALSTSAAQMDQITKTQAQVGKRVAELAEYERQYRTFLTAKQQAASPPGERKEG